MTAVTTEMRVEAIALTAYNHMTVEHERPWDDRLRECYTDMARHIIAADPLTDRVALLEAALREARRYIEDERTDRPIALSLTLNKALAGEP